MWKDRGKGEGRKGGGDVPLNLDRGSAEKEGEGLDVVRGLQLTVGFRDSLMA
jgi:hypothetical protein